MGCRGAAAGGWGSAQHSKAWAKTPPPPQPLPSPCCRDLPRTLGQQSQPVRKRTQALNKFIHEKTQGPSGHLLLTSSRSSRPNSGEGRGTPRLGVVGWRPPWAQKGRCRQFWGLRNFLHCPPALPFPQVPQPLGLKCSWEGGGGQNWGARESPHSSLSWSSLRLGQSPSHPGLSWNLWVREMIPTSLSLSDIQI